MPIKFRCEFCHQFLGISRSKAGDLTDCPTCGRTIRIPHLDGHVEPLPRPELNLHDAGLAKALGALASLQGGTLAIQDSPVQSDNVADTVDSSVDAPPVPLAEKLQSPDLVVPESAARGQELDGEESVMVSSTKGVSPSLKELVQLADSRPLRSKEHPDSRLPAGDLARVLIPACLAAFGAGILCGKLWNADASGPPSIGKATQVVPLDSNPLTEPAVAGNFNPQPIVPAPTAPAGEPAPATGASEKYLEGRVTYVAASGERRADRAARILLLPVERRGHVKLPTEAFLPGVEAADLELATSSLAAAGGALAIADDDGRFRMVLPGPGPFRAIVISRYQSRGVGVPLIDDAQQMLVKFFDRPERVMGKMQYHVQVLPENTDMDVVHSDVEFPR